MNLGHLVNSLKKPETSRKNRKSGAASFDLLYQLSYMTVIASAGVPRAQIFEHAAETRCAASDYFRRVQTACVRLKYDYAKACRLVGESTVDPEMKGLLLRFSSSLVSGEPEAEFLKREAEAQAEAYQNEYNRKLETLKLWTDAYVSLVLSAVLVIIVGIVSTMIWKIQVQFIVGLAFMAVATTGLGIWLIYLISPREFVVLCKPGSKEQKTVSRLFKLAAPAGMAVSAALLMLKMNAGWSLLVMALLAFPIGLISIIDDRKVVRRDSEVGAFIRSLGGICAAIGTTVRDGLAKLDTDAINTLRAEVKRLHTRLSSGIRPKLCWNKFVEESGSELANRTAGMFYDAIDLGGDPDRAGYHASLFASEVALLRARRKTVSSPFSWLCIAMHASVVVLLVFFSEVIVTFGKMVAQAGQSIPKIAGAPSVNAFGSFNLAGLQLMSSLVLPLVVVFTIANAVAPSIADGGSLYKLMFYGAIMAVISGLSLVYLPVLARMLFSGVGP